MQTRAHLYISGMVQGVYYRAFTRDVAHSFGLKGWVKNLYDGRVEAVFEGRREDVEVAIKRCYQGPSGAAVDDINVRWEDSREEFKDFEIRYY